MIPIDGPFSQNKNRLCKFNLDHKNQRDNDGNRHVLYLNNFHKTGIETFLVCKFTLTVEQESAISVCKVDFVVEIRSLMQSCLSETSVKSTIIIIIIYRHMSSSSPVENCLFFSSSLLTSSSKIPKLEFIFSALVLIPDSNLRIVSPCSGGGNMFSFETLKFFLEAVSCHVSIFVRFCVFFV